MLGSGGSRDSVTCIACGVDVERSDAREYDKHGDRWNRRNKEFEFLCRSCHDELSHQPRDGLEDLLATIDTDETDADAFVEQYYDRVTSRNE